MNSKISNKDKKDWENFLSKEELLPNKDDSERNTKITKTKSLDLHGHTLDGANQIIENFIKKSYEEKVSKLIIVTGKGIHSDNEKNPYVSKDLGILKFSIPEFIKNNSELMSIISEIKDANIEEWRRWSFLYLFKKKIIYLF